MGINLIQPMGNCGADPYMPTSKLTVGARLLNAGVEVNFHDENITPAEISADYVGFNLLGAPYIPEVINLQDRIRAEYGEKTFLVGGQPLSSPFGLSRDQVTRLFGKSTYNGNDDSILCRVLGIDPRALALPEQTSLIPAYEKLDDEVMKGYISREFPLFVSQGCAYDCFPCGATRSYNDPFTGQKVKVKETYRDIEIIKRDLDYLVGKAESFGLSEFNIYLSNLDSFQTPQKLEKFADAVMEVKRYHPGFDINMRGLSTVTSFLFSRDRKKFSKSIEKIVEAGFHTVGFGVDGWGYETWKAINKGHNTEERCWEAIRSAREDFGLTPEVLMVFGNPAHDNSKRNIEAAYEMVRLAVEKYGAIPRPHVAKNFIPGNDGWVAPEYKKQREILLNKSFMFQALDFRALHVLGFTYFDSESIDNLNNGYVNMLNLPGNTTQLIVPMTPDMTPEEQEGVRKDNQGKSDR